MKKLDDTKGDKDREHHGLFTGAEKGHRGRPRGAQTSSRIGAFCKTEITTGPETDAQFHFTGIKKYFNSYTLTGRMNCVLTTYGGTALMVLYFKLRSKKKPAVKAT
ncbi:ATP synthase membrane subunit DAPIT, mitochondrial-like [Zalophus californianus]|uniref:ATP synthase membrane subunit DAPIT, mitochondrial-like n=1 Tax=Zalophus californianus TaxID=9704 RepID=A0A6P9FER0_ZALCA|nr:ATP synthase membrane subunit DAPIT, mitochondrial-like [Zalophus californianus]